MRLPVPSLLRVFLRAPGARPFATAACLLVAGVVDVIGMSMIIPFVASLSRGGPAAPTRLGALGVAVLDKLGVPHEVGLILAAIAAALTLKSLLTLAAMSFVSRSVADVGLELRRALAQALMGANLRFFTAQHPGRIANTLVNEVGSAARAYNQAALAVAELLKLTGILAIAALISGWLLLAALVAAIGAGALLGRLVQWRRRAKSGQFEVTDTLLRRTQDTFTSIKALKGMQRIDPSHRMIVDGVEAIRHEVLRGQTTRHVINATQDIAMALALCGGIYACVALIGIGTAELIVLATLFLFMTNSLRLLQAQKHNFEEFEPSFLACEEVLAEARRHAEADGGRKPAQLAASIVFDAVRFAHGARTVFDGISFAIEAGRITVLQGESGVGKTTAIDLIIGFHTPQAGAVRVDGVPLADIDVTAWRSGIGYVPQELTLIEGSILDNITLGDERLDRSAVEQAVATAGLADFVASLPDGLDAPVGVFGGQLSGGQRQRISLARALVGKPRLLILDEATSALDYDTEREICDALARLSPPVTIIAIAHRPAWANIAHRILRFDERGVETLPTDNGSRQAAAP